MLFLATFPIHAAGPIAYAPIPNDSYWEEQSYLDTQNSTGASGGANLNVRGAWPRSRGAGVTVAIVDDGVELEHPDLAGQARPELHWNFEGDKPDGNHPSNTKAHGTPVAGLLGAVANNERGVAGVAPEARFASWVIYKTNATGGTFVSNQQLAKMFSFHNDAVQIQNHSWVRPGTGVVPMSPEEDAAIADAVKNGRAGRGVVMVRAGGNDRLQGRNANDDAYINDTRAIAVAAVRPDGVVAGYSNPGAAILVAAPGGELGFGTLFTTDRVGDKGLNRIGFTNDLADYVFESLGFVGTSAAAPLVSGVAALMLSHNPELGYRDVQQILLLSARQSNLNDTGVQTNGAGFFVSHNSGFGLVDAATAVELAGLWTNRPALSSTIATVSQELPVPDGSTTLRVESQDGGSSNLLIHALPSLGLHVNSETESLPLVYLGEATRPIEEDLTGKAALIRRGGTNFAAKIQHAAQAGASFAVIFNHEDAAQLLLLGGTDYTPIPAISISHADGQALTNLIAGGGVKAQIHYESSSYSFPVTDSLLCEHVKVTVRSRHPQRGDLRITLVSPAGTQSVLHRLGPDLTAFPGEWTYSTTHHFYESSQGQWRLFFGDEAVGGTGTIEGATLEILGVPIADQDADGLGDDWELDEFDSLAFGPKDDPDEDGYSNAREQILGLEPTRNDAPLALELSLWTDSSVHLNWPAREGTPYQVLSAPEPGQPLELVGEVAGRFPRARWIAPAGDRSRYFVVREKP